MAQTRRPAVRSSYAVPRNRGAFESRSVIDQDAEPPPTPSRPLSSRAAEAASKGSVSTRIAVKRTFLFRCHRLRSADSPFYGLGPTAATPAFVDRPARLLTAGRTESTERMMHSRFAFTRFHAVVGRRTHPHPRIRDTTRLHWIRSGNVSALLTPRSEEVISLLGNADCCRCDGYLPGHWPAGRPHSPQNCCLPGRTGLPQ